MDLIRKGSIRQKLMRISMLTTCVALLLTSVLLITNEVIAFRQSLIERMGVTAKIIGTNSTAALTFNDQKTAEETLSALKSGKNITCAVLFNRKGDVLAQYNRDGSAGDCRRQAVGPEGYHLGIHHLDILQRIQFDNESIGTLYIQSDLTELYRLIGWYSVTVFMVILLSIAIAFALMSRLQKIITKPLSEMADVMNTISGEKNYSVRVAVQSQDEVGILGEGFNEMLSQIQNRDTELELHRTHLQDLVTQRTEELARTNIDLQKELADRKRAEEELRRTLESLRNAVGATIQVMVAAVEARDPYTAGHQIRSADLARAIAAEMGLSQDQIDGIRMAGSIHDIGKLSIPAEILSKPTKLSKIEFSLIKEHARKGYEMLKDVESPWPLAEMVYQHHERMDGSGYPRNLKGDDILLEARIMAVADVVESMASHRPYRPALGLDAALEEIERNKGILYDAGAVDTCLRLFREKGYELPQG
jgi:HD-GYP domain-containing protein (c-di-GMP phosphodiesterase class II)